MSIEGSNDLHGPKRSKIITGTVIFIGGFLSPLLIPLVLNSGLSASMKSALSGLLVFGIPEIFMIVAAAVMGKSGYQYFKDKLGSFFKRISPDRVSPVRYSLGLLMFSIPIVLGFLQPYLAHYIPQLGNLHLGFTIGLDFMLLLSLFVLGGDFWEKLKSLFLYNVVVNKGQLNNT